MALDHFVSQVHLRKFYARALNSRKMFAWRKSDLLNFPCDARDVCRIPEGSTNQYIADPRAAEEFLRLVEPRYNHACAAAISNGMTYEDVFSLAGFAAFVGSCSPTAIRLSQHNLAALAETEARVLDEAGMIDRSPPELGKRTISELLENGEVLIDVDRKFAQSVGIAQLLEITNAFADTLWEFVHNPFEDSPFLTSDFPVTVAPIRRETALRRFIPLRPDLGAYVRPSRSASARKPSSLRNFRRVLRPAKRTEVHALNRLVVQCAEHLIFGNVDAPWVARLVKRNAKLSVINTTGRVKTNGGYYTFTSLGVGERT